MPYEFSAAKDKVYNRGRAPQDFLTFLVGWARDAPNELFDYNNAEDAYGFIEYKLGPWKAGADFLLHRRAVMCEVLRVLCGFESSWRWDEGIDQSANNGKPYARHIREWEAGILQASSNSMYSYEGCKDYAAELGIGINDHEEFRTLSMKQGTFSMKQGTFPIQYGATILRETYKHHGPLRRTENNTANPQKSSIHPYLSKVAVEEFEAALQR